MRLPDLAARRTIALAIVGLAALSLSACGDKLLESQETAFILADPLEHRRTTEPRHHQRWPDHPVSSANKRLHSPLVVGAVIDPTRKPAPLMSLMRVAVDLYPPIDCDDPPDWLMASGTFDVPAPVAAERLADLGTPVRSAELWVVPGSRDGAYVDVSIPADSASGRAIAMEASHSGVTPELQYHEPFETVFQFGPDWLGLPLRQAGVGRTVVFPPSQDCSSAERAQDDRLPTRVIVYGAFDQGSSPDKYIRVPADVPFTARVIATCPLSLSQKKELVEVRTGPIYRPPSREWRFSATARGECEGGVVKLEFGPLTTPVIEGNSRTR